MTKEQRKNKKFCPKCNQWKDENYEFIKVHREAYSQICKDCWEKEKIIAIETYNRKNPKEVIIKKIEQLLKDTIKSKFYFFHQEEKFDDKNYKFWYRTLGECGIRNAARYLIQNWNNKHYDLSIENIDISNLSILFLVPVEYYEMTNEKINFTRFCKITNLELIFNQELEFKYTKIKNNLDKKLSGATDEQKIKIIDDALKSKKMYRGTLNSL